MSMLAEKKTKTKWILDPRQNDWTKDSNKFGQKMLEKMGWTPGKGLGVSEQGITTALRVKYKSDNKGLGCKEVKFESLMQQKKFEMLLSELNSENNSLDSENKLSLEERSKMTKKRVFYHKSIKGKDITRYSERDLQCIFGFDKKNKSIDGSCDLANHLQENTDLNLEILNKKRKFDTENENNEVIDTRMYSGAEEAEKIVESQETDSVENGIKKKRKKSKYPEVLLNSYNHYDSEVLLSEETELKAKVKNKEKDKKFKQFLSNGNENNEADVDVIGDKIENKEAERRGEINNIKKMKKNKFGQNNAGIKEKNEMPQEVNSEISLESEGKKKKTKRKDHAEGLIDSQNGDCEEVENKHNIFKKKKKKNKECL